MKIKVTKDGDKIKAEIINQDKKKIKEEEKEKKKDKLKWN